jgi:uncharacterized repeat protein (TIGR01451 family)
MRTHNNGTVTLSHVTVTDLLAGMSSITPSEYESVAPDEMVTFTATYLLNQDDLDNGWVNNTATTEGTSPQGVTVTDTDSAEVLIPEYPAIDISKSGVFLDENNDGYGQLGESVAYTFNVTNNGTVTLSHVTVTDLLAGMSSITPSEYESVAPDEMVTFTATYLLNQDDLDNGWVNNTATTEGTSPQGVTVTDTDSAEVLIPEYPHINLTKTADPLIYSYPGQVINYTLVATNDGNVNLHDVDVTDSLLGTLTCTWPGNVGLLAPGESVTCKGNYTIQSSDVLPDLSGKVINTAEANGLGPQGQEANDTASATVTQVASTAQLAPTGTTCSQFMQGTAGNLEQAAYLLDKKANTITSVAPGVMFYYSKVTPEDDGSLTVEVKQSNNQGWTMDLAIQDEGQVILWDADCTKVPVTVIVSGGNFVLTATGLDPTQTYYLGVKYSLSSLQSYMPPTSSTDTYTFVMYQDGKPVLTSWDSIDLVKKK